MPLSLIEHRILSILSDGLYHSIEELIDKLNSNGIAANKKIIFEKIESLCKAIQDNQTIAQETRPSPENSLYYALVNDPLEEGSSKRNKNGVKYVSKIPPLLLPSEPIEFIYAPPKKKPEKIVDNIRSVTYAITDKTAIKIGKTRGLISIRMADLQVGNPSTLRLLAYTKYSSEKVWHKRLELWHRRGEWYNIVQELLTTIVQEWEYIDEGVMNSLLSNLSTEKSL